MCERTWKSARARVRSTRVGSVAWPGCWADHVADRRCQQNMAKMWSARCRRSRILSQCKSPAGHLEKGKEGKGFGLCLRVRARVSPARPHTRGGAEASSETQAQTRGTHSHTEADRAHLQPRHRHKRAITMSRLGPDHASDDWNTDGSRRAVRPYAAVYGRQKLQNADIWHCGTLAMCSILYF